jgi:hypothetical protein
LATAFSDLVYGLVSVQSHALKAGHDYGRYVRDARNGGFDDVAGFVEQVMKEDSHRAARCQAFLTSCRAPNTPARRQTDSPLRASVTCRPPRLGRIPSARRRPQQPARRSRAARHPLATAKVVSNLRSGAFMVYCRSLPSSAS